MNSKTEFHQHPVVRIIPLRGLQEEQGEAGEARGRAWLEAGGGAEAGDRGEGGGPGD